MAAQSGRAKVVVAVDFGTTFSGFAYAKPSDPDDVFKIYEWPGAGKASAKPYCKNQTSLFYAPSPASDSYASFQLVDWGWSSLIAYTEAARAFAKSVKVRGAPGLDKPMMLPDILGDLNIGERDSSGAKRPNYPDVMELSPEIAEKIGFYATKFKLLLAPDADQTNGLSKLPGGLTVERMVVDYLQCLTKFIMSELQVNYGKTFSMKDVQWCLTVPAIWDERSKQVMKSCAEKAGMVQGISSPGSAAGSPFPVDIILEPEAASVYCQHKCKGLNLKKGEKLLVADVGGGTIDLVVHAKADSDPESVRVHEVVSSYGELGGGTFVDAAFFRFVYQKIGCFEEFARTNKLVVIKMSQWWQGVKAAFDGEGYSADCPLPKNLIQAWEEHDKSYNIHHDRDYYDELRLDGSEIKAIFDPEVEKVIRLIRTQVQGTRVLMVVGGFSESPYLRNRIKQAFQSTVEEVIIPENPGSAICHGAVQLHLKQDAIQSRVAKRTYGIWCHRLVEDGDPEDLRFKDADGVWRCKDCILVFVTAGEQVPLNASITKSYYPSHSRQKELAIKLISSASKSPKYVREEVEEGVFYVDMSKDMSLDTARRVEVTMVFGASLVVVTAEKANFGQPGKEKGLSVTFEGSGIH